MDSSNNQTRLSTYTLFGDNTVPVEEFTEQDWGHVLSFLKKTFSGTLNYYNLFKPLKEWLLSSDNTLETSFLPDILDSTTVKLLRTKCLFVCEFPGTYNVEDDQCHVASKKEVLVSERNHLYVTAGFRWWNVYRKEEDSRRERTRHILSVGVTEIEGDALTSLLASRAFKVTEIKESEVISYTDTRGLDPLSIRKKLAESIKTSLTPMGAKVLYAFSKFSLEGVKWREGMLSEFSKRDRKLADVLKRIDTSLKFCD